MEFLLGKNNELVIKEVAVVGDVVMQTFHFRPPYFMEPHCSKENGLNWDDGFIHYSQVQMLLTEALASNDHLYARGSAKCDLLGEILN